MNSYIWTATVLTNYRCYQYDKNIHLIDEVLNSQRVFSFEGDALRWIAWCLVKFYVEDRDPNEELNNIKSINNIKDLDNYINDLLDLEDHKDVKDYYRIQYSMIL